MALLRKNKSEKKQKLAHILAGVLILVHAYEKFDKHEPAYLFFVVAGVIFLSVALLHHKLIHHFHYIDGVFFLIEAALYGVIATEYFHEGKKGLPWCYVFCVVAYTVAAIVVARAGKKKYLQHTAVQEQQPKG